MYLFKFQRPISNNHHHQQPNFYFPFHKISSHSNQSVLLFNPSSPPPPFLSIPNSVQRTKSSNCFTRQLNKHGRVLASIILPRFVTVAWDKSVLVTVLHFEKLGKREKSWNIFNSTLLSWTRRFHKKGKKKKITLPVA